MFFITNSRQNKQKERKTGFSSILDILVIIAFTKQKKKKQHSKDFLSFSFSLSLLGKNTLSKKAASDSFCAVYITAFSKLTTLYNHRQHHLLPSKGRERERDLEISLSRAQRARAAQARLGEIQNKKTSLFFVFVSKTDS